MTDPAALRAAGTSASAIAHHYDLSDDFFRLWLGADLTYSCALWGAATSLREAQQAKIDYFATRLGVRGSRVLDVGCGWGALLERFHRVHGMAAGVGLTLSENQAAYASDRGVRDVGFERRSWVDHDAAHAYDVVTAIESTEHLASDALSADEKVDVYRAFFARAASWLRDGGRLGLQLICLDGLGHEGSRPGRGPVAQVIGTDIFPESMPASLSELALAWDAGFALSSFENHTDHYERTFRAWALAFRAHRERAEALVGPDVCRTFASYFAAGEVCFRLREHALYRVILTKRPAPKDFAVTLRPSMLTTGAPRRAGASAAAVRHHYDLSNDFYRSWLGPSMMYSSGMWAPEHDPSDLAAAHDRKIDYFATRVLAGTDRVLDVGCGWGGTLRALRARHGVAGGIGLTLSDAQRAHIAADPIDGVRIRVQDWADHIPERPYDAIFSFGAFEHFARDGSPAPQRVAAYRHFFMRCHSWLRPGGRIALETIAHDGAPDTARPLGRGPLGDSVLALFPESIAPHLAEVVLGFEPWFEVEVLRSDAADFARTFRCWQVRLRRDEQPAVAAVGTSTVRLYRRYLAASEVQFRDGTLTNLRLVLHRRDAVKR